jgi:hypothetical protein
MILKINDAPQVCAQDVAEPVRVESEEDVLFSEFREELLSRAQSLRKTSRGFAPSPGPMRPRCSRISIIRAARV